MIRLHTRKYWSVVVVGYLSFPLHLNCFSSTFHFFKYTKLPSFLHADVFVVFLVTGILPNLVKAETAGFCFMAAFTLLSVSSVHFHSFMFIVILFIKILKALLYYWLQCIV